MPGRPAPQPPTLTPDVYQLTQKVVFLAQICQFSAYYFNPPLGGRTVLQGANMLQSLWTLNVVPALQGLIATATTFLETRVWSLHNPDVVTTVTAQVGITGARPGDPLPPQVAGCFSKHTNIRGKSGRGRMYLCGMSETDSTNGVPNAGWIAQCPAAVLALKQIQTDAGTGNTFTPVVVATHLYVNTGTPAIPVWHVQGSPITSVIAPLIWNTQRRRTIGRGQ